jgi:hypothetical protein
MRLCAREDYIESCRRESFKTYNRNKFSRSAFVTTAMQVCDINVINVTTQNECQELLIRLSLTSYSARYYYDVCFNTLELRLGLRARRHL